MGYPGLEIGYCSTGQLTPAREYELPPGFEELFLKGFGAGEPYIYECVIAINYGGPVGIKKDSYYVSRLAYKPEQLDRVRAKGSRLNYKVLYMVKRGTTPDRFKHYVRDLVQSMDLMYVSAIPSDIERFVEEDFKLRHKKEVAVKVSQFREVAPPKAEPPPQPKPKPLPPTPKTIITPTVKEKPPACSGVLFIIAVTFISLLLYIFM